MKAHLISNVTMQPLVAALEPIEVTLGQYDSLLLELADARSVSADCATTYLFCLFDTDTLLGESLYSASPPDRALAFLDLLDRFCEAHPAKAVLVNTFCAGSARARSFLDLLSDSSPRAWESRLNARLIAMAHSRSNLILVDIEMLYRRFGEDKLHSAAFWYAGRIRYTAKMFAELAKLVRQALSAYSSQARKVLVLDLDNTLWGGIVGELGATGVALGHDGLGRAYQDFQRSLKALKETGVLLAICSKNNAADVDEVFEQNSQMILSRDDFVALRVNWNPKPENLLDIARSLNLGLQSFVFLDDSPVERRLVVESLPEVAVPIFPSKPEALPRWFVDEVVFPYFPRYRLTNEDLRKTEQYKANELRSEFARTLYLDAFLRGLNINCTLRVDEAATIQRAAQMTQKTNQFNLTTLRCEPREVEQYVNDPDRALVVLDYADRFGTEGLVALALLDFSEARIANLLMSCRVVGRKVEDRLFAKVMELFSERGVTRIVGEFIPSRKNQMVATFYDERGFSLVFEDADGRKLYERIAS
ncbi:MAG: HAD-IIIC family phosphatase [Candidatus Baltobacteraceae bacterium]